MDNASRSDRTRSRLINAAIELLVERGYRSLSLVEIARRAELSRGAVHHHFTGLTDVVVEVVREVGARISANIRNIEYEGMPRDQVVAAGIDNAYEQLLTDEFTALMQIRSAVRTSPELHGAVQDEMRTIIYDWYAQAEVIANAAMTEGGSELLIVVMAAVNGVALLDEAIGTPAEDPNRRAFRATLTAMVLGAGS
ncbi:MAG: helix-turn-helix domain-containing protein [Pseudomonadota bacterium]